MVWLGLRADDVLFVHLLNDVGNPVYYIAVDREKYVIHAMLSYLCNSDFNDDVDIGVPWL
jgi:hypothetical protein